jgi:dTMP kinase
MKKSKLLIAVEGIDGAGKSVQTVLLQMSLERAGHAAKIIKAKTSGQNEIVRNFTKEYDIKSDSMAFMFLYQALHRQQYERTVAALSEGNIVIADRWDTSFFVYHGITGPLSKHPKKLLDTLNKLAFEGMQPDIRFFIDIPVQTALDRRIVRGDKIDSIAKETRFYRRVAAEYRQLFESQPHHSIDGTLPIEEIGRQMLAITLQHI